MASLGEGEYNVFIAFSSDPEQTIATLPFSDLAWQRTQGHPSEASFKIPGADGGINCCGFFGGLRPWDHMLVIERNNYVVWDGPVVGWSTDGDAGDGTVEVRAIDRSSILSKTLVGKNRRHAAGTVDLDALIAAILAEADFSQPPFSVDFDVDAQTYFSQPRPGEVDLHVERLDALDRVFGQIAETTDWFMTCRGANIDFCEYKVRGRLTPEGVAGQYALGFDNNWLTLNEETTIGVPNVNVDGMALATVAYLGGANAGASGHAIVAQVDLRSAVWYVANGDPPPYIVSTLQSGSSNLTQSDDASIESAAENLAIQVMTPNLTIEQLQLSPSFGGRALLPSLDNLMPGTRFNLGFTETCAFSTPSARRAWVYSPTAGAYDWVLAWAGDTTHVRLEQLDVTVNAEGEKVMGSFVPTVEIVTAPVTVNQPSGAVVSRRIVY